MRKYLLPLIIILLIILGLSCTVIKIEKPVLKNNAINCDSLREGGFFQEVPNLNFEYWTASSSKRYEEPTPTCFWTTPSKANDIIKQIPITVTKVTGDSAHSGTYGCMIKSHSWNGLFTSGTVAAGVFSPNFQNPLKSIQFGQPFNRKVREVRGWYKFWSVNRDSCSMYCYMLKKNGNRQDTIAFTRYITNQTQPNWTEFILTPVYRNTTVVPDKLILYFASSEEGDELKGQVGNTLIIDDISVSYY